MPERVDVLEGRMLQPSGLRGRLLDPGEDRVLQELATEAAQELGTSSATVSLLYDQRQLLKGAHNLDFPERVIDRDQGVCQYVLKEQATVEMPDIKNDPRPLADSVKSSLGSYLGQPLHVDGEVVGALCVFDPQPRKFSIAQRAALKRLADRVDRRLAEMSAEQRGAWGAEELLRAATRPVFQELRNALWQLTMSIDEIRDAAEEAQKLAALVSSGELAGDKLAFDVGNAAEAAAHIRMLVDEAQTSTQRLEHGLFALEAAAQKKGQSCNLPVVLSSAQKLADHYLKLIGGLDLKGVAPQIVAASPGAATTQIATALAILAEALIAAHEVNGKLVAGSARVAERIVLRLTSQLPPEAVRKAADHLRQLIGASAAAAIAADGPTLTLSFAQGSPES